MRGMQRGDIGYRAYALFGNFNEINIIYNKFLLLSFPQLLMPQEKTKRCSQRSLLPQSDSPATHPVSTIKFNISDDNLRPFVQSTPSPRTPPKLPRYRELRYQREKKLAKTEQSCHQSPQDTLQHSDLRRDLRSPDVPREASNVILRAIEAKGIGCVWAQVEQSRSECEEEQWQVGQVWKQQVQVQKNPSVASTNDQYSGYYSPMYQQNYAMYEYERRYYDPTYFVIDVMTIGQDQRTTLMIKNIPNKYTIQFLAEQIDREHANCYDFLYLPCDIKNNCNVGYGFINLINTDVLLGFYERFQNKRWGKFKSEKICNLTYARLQGLGSLIEHFQNSKVLNHKDKKYQPIIREMSSIDSLIQLQKATAPTEMP